MAHGFLLLSVVVLAGSADAPRVDFDRAVRPASFQLPGLSTTDRFLAPARNLRESFRLPWQK